jgi:putative ATP-dependent endonuclease of OLD family
VNHPDLTINDYEFLVFGGVDEKNRLDFDVRRWIPIEVLPALRDAESDLGAWRQSPLRPLVEKLDIDHATLEEVACRIDGATEQLLADTEIQQLVLKMQERISKMVGGVHAIETSLGFTPTVPERLARELRLFGDGTRQRRVGELSLGLNNVLYLALLALELERKEEALERASTTLAIEEPEAHLHPHLQRLVFRDFLRRESPLVLTTHSPHIASVAPLKSVVLLRDDPNGDGTKGTSTHEVGFSDTDVVDLERYLDATRAEILFARGVILVEGASEMFLVPEIAARMGTPLDQYGITVCSVHGIDFMPYAKLLGPQGLAIPFVILTDGDWRVTSNGDRVSAGLRRAARLAGVLSPDQSADLANMSKNREWKALREMANQIGVFVGDQTLEVDLFNEGHGPEIVDTMEELGLSTPRKKALRQILERDTQLNDEDIATLLRSVEGLGKGRVSQRLAGQVDAAKSPAYIRDSISKIVEKLGR